MRAMQGEKVPMIAEVEAKAKTGELVPVEVSGTLIDYQGRPAILFIVRDIRERKQMEEQRLKLEKLASIGELATMVAHDLRNPLTSIRNAGFYIKNSCPARATGECKSAIEMLDIIEEETIFANNIINDLLDFAAKRPLEKKRQSMNKIIEDSLEENKIPENIEVEKTFDKKAITDYSATGITGARVGVGYNLLIWPFTMRVYATCPKCNEKGWLKILPPWNKE